MDRTATPDRLTSETFVCWCLAAASALQDLGLGLAILVLINLSHVPYMIPRPHPLWQTAPEIRQDSFIPDHHHVYIANVLFRLPGQDMIKTGAVRRL